MLRAINANLPADIAVLDLSEAPAGFHAISHARRKRYRYVIHDGPVREVFGRHYAWHYACGRLDAAAMHRAAAALLGTHDFRSFETAGAPRPTSVRTVFDLSVRRGRAGQGGEEQLGAADAGPATGAKSRRTSLASVHQVSSLAAFCSDDFIIIEIEADGFLYNMVRAIVGTLVEVGRGRRSETWPGEVLRAQNRRAAGPTAPPQGLFLVRVEY